MFRVFAAVLAAGDQKGAVISKNASVPGSICEQVLLVRFDLCRPLWVVLAGMVDGNRRTTVNSLRYQPVSRTVDGVI